MNFFILYSLDGSCEKAVKGIECISSMPHEGGGDKSISVGEPSDLDLDLDEEFLAAPNNLDVWYMCLCVCMLCVHACVQNIPL